MWKAPAASHNPWPSRLGAGPIGRPSLGFATSWRPLVTEHLACALPVQEAVDGLPWLLEICPASTLKAEWLSFPYKGRTQEHALARERILDTFERSGRVFVPPEIRSRLLLDSSGDALDSVIAAIGVARTLDHPELLRCDRDQAYAVEGRVLL